MDKALADFAQSPLTYDLHEMMDDEEIQEMAHHVEALRKELYEAAEMCIRDRPTTEWLNKYEAIKDKLTCKADLEAHFTEKVIGNMAVDVLDIGCLLYTSK